MSNSQQLGMNLPDTQPVERVDEFRFEPIKGYPMLNWKGKRPLTSTNYYPAQLKEVHGEEVDGWLNKIYWGDNLQVMSHLLKEYRGRINLVYIDPPFDSKIEYKKTVETKRKRVENDYSGFEEKQYADIWTNDEYLQFMYERLLIIRELMSHEGILCLHCDWHKAHHLRCILDEVFGSDAFRNEIIWHFYNKMQGNINRFATNNNSIIVYSKSKQFTFNRLKEKRTEPVKQIKRVWSKEKQSIVNDKDENGKVTYINSTHKTIDNVWRLPMLQPSDNIEPLDYPTRKPECLLERIISAFSNPGDIVLDCFMGSGTTQAVSMKLGRRFLGTDINLGSVQLTTKRLIDIERSITASDYAPDIKNGLCKTLSASPSRLSALDSDEGNLAKLFEIKKIFSGFEIYNVNHYDVFRNPLHAKELLSEALEINPLAKGSLFDGEKDGRMWKIMPVDRIATKADLSPLVSNFDYKAFEKRQQENPKKPVEKITLVCMGHDPDLKAALQSEVKPYEIDVEVINILRDRQDLQFKRDSEAEVTIQKGELIIKQFYPINLLSKLSLQQENVEDWREMVESVMIDWNYDGAVLEPKTVDIPGKNELVKGTYTVPKDAGTIRIKITDLLSESLEMEVQRG